MTHPMTNPDRDGLEAAYDKAGDLMIDWNANTLQHARNKVDAIITAYLSALAPPVEAEPVGYTTAAGMVALLDGFSASVVAPEVADEQFNRPLYAAPPSSPPHHAPEGMVTVPREPTEAMVRAGRNAWILSDDEGSCAAEIYRAMIAAASPAQAKEGKDANGAIRICPERDGRCP